MAVWYPRNGEGQDGVVDSVPNKVRNAWPRASFGHCKDSSMVERLT